jgi:Toprim domain
MSGIDRVIEDSWAHRDNQGTTFEVQVGLTGPLLSGLQVAEWLGGKLLNGSTHILAYGPNGEGQGGKRGLLIIFDTKYKEGFTTVNRYDPSEWRRDRDWVRKCLGLKCGEIFHVKVEGQLYARLERLRWSSQQAQAVMESSEYADAIVARYLRTRGLSQPVPSTIRSGRWQHRYTKREYPIMVAPIEGPQTRQQHGVHITYLREDGSGKARVELEREIYGSVKSGIVRLFEPVEGRIAIAEGIETALSFAQLYSVPVWAVLSAFNLAEISPPSDITSVVIAADNDPAGLKFANKAAQRFLREGRHCEIVFPEVRGMDWNDILVKRLRHV